MYHERHTESQYNFVHQHLRHSICTFVFYWKRLGPLAEVVGDDKDVTKSVRVRVTYVQNIHSDPIPTMTSRNIAQWVMSTGRRFPLQARGTILQPIAHVICHTGPIETVI